jgi:hypothetical protein
MSKFLHNLLLVSGLMGSLVVSAAQARLSTTVSLDSEANIRRPDEEDFSASSSLGLGLNYKLSSAFSLGAQLGANKDLVDEQKIQMTDTQIQASAKGPSLGAGIASSLGASLNLPTSTDSRERDNLRASLSLRPKVSRSLDFVSMPESQISLRLGLTAFNHRYTTTTYGRSNAAFSTSMGVDLLFTLGAGFTLALGGAYANSWTYEQNLVQAFNSSQSLDYEISSQLSASLSHRNGGSLMRADGVTSNIDLFSARSSFVGVGVSATF